MPGLLKEITALQEDEAVSNPVEITIDYFESALWKALCNSDEHRFQSLLNHLRQVRT